MFKTKDQLNCHLQTHRKPEDIKCQYCNHVLHSSSALTKHVKAKHEKVSYSCPYCQKSFSTSAYCQKHIETCKLSVPCICSICNKSFKNSSTLDTHQRTHNRTQCDVCQMYYPSRKSMLDHRSKVHINLIDKYCRFCKTTFSTKANLIQHMKRVVHDSYDVNKAYIRMANGDSIYMSSSEIKVTFFCPRDI